ncbi:hypothetical protein B0H10DRAFT_1947218 [Mycena sp. CBHHK59/15]|nr:hypothetical protein B0H10DRAFT_1947218 [Mycena sp. CBHHK59/15]
MPRSLQPRELLHTSAIDRLPSARKDVALRAVAGSLPDLTAIVDCLPRGPEGINILYFIPTIYVNLDSTRIPRSDVAEANPCPPSVLLATVALQGAVLLDVTLVPELAHAFWRRVVKWVLYHHKHGSEITGYTEADIISLSIRIIAIYAAVNGLSIVDALKAEPGIYILVVSAWVHILDNPTLPVEIGAKMSALFVQLLDISDAAQLQKFVDAAGSLSEFVSLIVRHLQATQHFTKERYDFVWGLVHVVVVKLHSTSIKSWTLWWTVGQ